MLKGKPKNIKSNLKDKLGVVAYLLPCLFLIVLFQNCGGFETSTGVGPIAQGDSSASSQNSSQDNSPPAEPQQVHSPPVVKNTMAGKFQFDKEAYTVGEADGKVIVIINRTGGSNGAVTVEYRPLGVEVIDQKPKTW